MNVGKVLSFIFWCGCGAVVVSYMTKNETVLAMFWNRTGAINFQAARSSEYTYKNPIEILNMMPDSLLPKNGTANSLERGAATKWLQEKLVGDEVEFVTTIKHADFSGTGPFRISAYFSGEDLGKQIIKDYTRLWPEFLYSGQKYQFAIVFPTESDKYIYLEDVALGFHYSGTFEEGKVVRNNIDEKITCRAKITDCEVVSFESDRLVLIGIRVMPYQAKDILPKGIWYGGAK